MTENHSKQLDKFKTKARTLLELRNILKNANILPMVIFNKKEWDSNKEYYVSKVKNLSKNDNFIIRSSALEEDNYKSSNAGKYLSILNVKLMELEINVEKVFGSYSDKKFNDEIFIQPMLQNVILSGVAFSHDPNTLSPYRLINWLDGKDTKGITSGSSGNLFQYVEGDNISIPIKLRKVTNLLQELLQIFCQKPIDFEFAIVNKDKKEELFLLQVRPLILREQPISSEKLKSFLSVIEKKMQRDMKPKPYLLGEKTIYGVMPDWNPAEILGTRPKPLALSLYRELVTDSIWAYQRHNYGYKNLRSCILMPHFFGLPYIDVRLSFNSFIPANLDKDISERLVNYYINSLLDQPSLHDKIEFQIVFSCYTLDIEKKLEKLSNFGFNEDDQQQISKSLRKLTNKIVNKETGLWKQDEKKIRKLIQRRTQIIAYIDDPIEKLYWLLEDTKRYGTLPFAGLARAGFIAIQLLQSLVSTGILSDQDYQNFMTSITTVSSELKNDKKLLSKEDFLLKYGHLRPGTYDILSARYDEDPDLYFDWENNTKIESGQREFSLKPNQIRAIENLLIENKLELDPIGLFEFIQTAIELRELAKFYFTKNLSDALLMMEMIGKEYGFSRNDISFSNIKVFYEIYTSAIDSKNKLLISIEEGKKDFQITKHLSMPPLISETKSLWSFIWPNSEPNFITQSTIIGNVIKLDPKKDIYKKMDGAIICIPNADPGYDWLFSHSIGGLITAWGGANSHMAIRAGELSIPAIIGTGELLYEKWSNSKRLNINCSSKIVEIIK